MFLYQQIAFVPLFPSYLDSGPLFPKTHGRASLKEKKKTKAKGDVLIIL